MMLRKLPLAVAAATSLLLFFPLAAQAATGTGEVKGQPVSIPIPSPVGGISHLSVTPGKSACQRVTSVPGVSKRCTQGQEIPLTDLTAAQRAQRSADLARLGSKSESAHAGVSQQPDITAPAQCNFSAIEFAQTGILHPDRFTSCSDVLWLATSYEVTSTPPFITFLGTFLWEDQQWADYSAHSPDWVHGMNTIGYLTGASGDLEDGVSGVLYSGCSLAPGTCSAASLATPDPQPFAIAPGGTDTFGWNESDAGASSVGPGAINVLNPYLGAALEIENTTPPTEALDTAQLAGRCDTQVTAADRCVDQAYTPTLELSLTTYGSAADMIAWAQGTLSGHWGLQGVGQPLTRLASAVIGNRNRRIICRDGSFHNMGAAIGGNNGDRDSCDEYPFAATYQSGALNGVTAGAQCAQVTAVQTGTTGNEAADWNTVTPAGTVTGNEACARGHIPLRLNRNTGLAYARLILSDRLIDRDPFWVAVTP